MRSFVARHQVGVFFALTVVLSWYPWYAGIAPEVLAVGPSLAAFIIVFYVDGKRGLGDLLRPFLRWRAGLGWWGVAIFGTAGIFLLGLAVHLVLGGAAPPFIMIRQELYLIPLYLVIVVLMPWNGPVGEEFGWRGFALPRLQSAHGPLLASLVIGTIWGVWHLPTLFAPLGVLGALTSAIGLGFIVPYTMTTIASSIFMTWLYNKTHKSALLAGIIWHASTDFWAPIILSDSSLVAAQQGTHLPTIEPSLYLTVAMVLAICAGVVVVATKGRLGLAATERVG